MNRVRSIAIAGAASLALAATAALAAAPQDSLVGAGGYDVVAYHSEGMPVRGNGNHVVVHQGATYLFANDDNREAFAANPERYAPAYGGYCAYGVAVGKKFVGDPEVWKIVDGKLYLNLDEKIQRTWEKDVPGNIAKAEKQWPQIEDKLPSEL